MDSCDKNSSENKKKVLVCLPDYKKNHNSYYNYLITNVLSNVDVTLLVYTNDKDFISNYKTFNAIYPKDKENSTLFILRNLKVFQKADFIVFDEFYKPSSILPFIVLVYGKKSILTVHNVNKWFNRGKALHFKSKFISTLIQLMVKRLAAVIVVSLSLKEYLDKNLFYEKRVFYLPFVEINNDLIRKKITQKDYTIFTIPGTINVDRRDYSTFLKAFHYLVKVESVTKFKLILLGKVVKLGDEELKLIKEINEISENAVVYWDSYIDENTHNEYLLKSDYLIGNINIEYKENFVTEFYGVSKETGTLFLMLKYNIPTLFPDNYSAHDIYENFIIHYENKMDSIVDVLKNLIIAIPKENKGFNFNEQHIQLISNEVLSLNSFINDN